MDRSKDRSRAKDSGRARVLVIEENPLTAWVVEQTLSPSFDVIRCLNLDEANAELQHSDAQIVICGGPIADENPEAVRRLASVAGRRVVALVSAPESTLLADVPVLEKPFELGRLTQLLTDGKPRDDKEATPAGKQNMLLPTEQRERGNTIVPTLADRLRMRFEKEICAVCVHRTAAGGCTLKDGIGWVQCPLFEWAGQLAELVKGIDSLHLADYIDRIQAIICPTCKQCPDGSCKARDHLDCPVDLYLGMIVPIIEEELRQGAPACAHKKDGSHHERRA